MADLEQRVTTLEREVSVLKERVAADEEDVRNIPDLIKMEFRLANSQMARLSRDVGELKEGFAKLRDLPAPDPVHLAQLLNAPGSLPGHSLQQPVGGDHPRLEVELAHQADPERLEPFEPEIGRAHV